MVDIDFTLYEGLIKAAKEHPFDLALYYQGRKIRFNKLVKKVDEMADILYHKLEIRSGDIVLVAQPNIPEVVILVYALNKIGAVANLVHPFTPYNQLVSMYYKTHSSLAILFEQRVAKEIEQYRGFAENVIVTRIEDYLPLGKKLIYHFFMNTAIRRKLGKWRGKFKGFRYLHSYKPTGKPVQTEANDLKKVSIMLHSGSTTGEPKTICLSNGNFNFINAHSYEFTSRNKEQLRNTYMLSILPSFHGFGLCMTMVAPINSGFGSALIPKFSPKEVVKAMKKIKISCMCGIPGIYESLLNDNKFATSKHLKHLHICFSGGDSMSITLKKRWDDTMKANGSHCQLFEGYGLTEAIAVNCVNTFDHNKEGSIGYPGSGFEFITIDENENHLKANEIGQICIKSPATMLHYFANEEATIKTFTKDGYLKTGDLGYIDEDGFIFFKQRAKRVIKVSGVGVFPSEIEQLIQTVPGVINCCAISIPDKRLVHAVKVFVVAKYFDEEGMRRSIMDTCRKYLIRWSVPKEIVFVKELPMTLLGKVDFNKLQKQENKERGIADE